MQPDVKRAFVFGGSGTVGSAVLRELARRGVPAVFTFHRSADKAKVLAQAQGDAQRFKSVLAEYQRAIFEAPVKAAGIKGE